MKTLPKTCHLCARTTPEELGDDWIRDTWSKWLVCPDCIRKGRALRADPKKQNFDGLGGPIDAFWDQTRHCEMCAKDYLFSAEEQRFWYETLGFFVESAPLQCQDCRRAIRAQKRAQRILQAMLPLAPDSSWQQLEEVAQAAATYGASNAIDYLRRAKNRCDDPIEKARLESEVASFKAAPRLEIRGAGDFVEQLELHYRKEPDTNILSDEQRANVLKAPGLSRNECKLVARIDGMWVRPEPDLQDRRQLAYLHGELICPNMPPHQPKVLIDHKTGVLIYLPLSGTRGQTGHYRHANKIYGPPGPLPWI